MKWTSTASRPGRVVETQQRNALLIAEFEAYVARRGWLLRKEVPFSELFSTKRRFRADYLLEHSTGARVIIEINGGMWLNGRHNRGGNGYYNDLTKANLAQANGIPIYQFTYEHLAAREYEEIGL